MFASVPEAMAFALTKSQFMIHRMIDDLKPHEFEHQPFPGVNCIAWVVGHLTLTDRRQLTWLGVPDLPPVPDGFEERFKVTRTTAVEQKGFGDPKELVALFDAHRRKLIDCLPTVDPAKFFEPPSFQTPMFADRGEGTLFMGLHTAMHSGQISLIRRSLGYPPVS
jgi:hypothetical protein